MTSMLTLIVIVSFQLPLFTPGAYYNLVKTKIPLSGIIKTLHDVKEMKCVLSCRRSKNCLYSAMHLQNENCLHLNTTDVSNGGDTLTVNVLERMSPGSHVTPKEKGGTSLSIGCPLIECNVESFVRL